MIVSLRMWQLTFRCTTLSKIQQVPLVWITFHFNNQLYSLKIKIITASCYHCLGFLRSTYLLDEPLLLSSYVYFSSRYEHKCLKSEVLLNNIFYWRSLQNIFRTFLKTEQYVLNIFRQFDKISVLFAFFAPCSASYAFSFVQKGMFHILQTFLNTCSHQVNLLPRLNIIDPNFSLLSEKHLSIIKRI